MNQSRRAMESYWRSKMRDGAMSDEDKVTPVYKLEEIFDLLRSAHVSIVKKSPSLSSSASSTNRLSSSKKSVI